MQGGRKEAFSWIFALASSSDGTRTFVHKSQVLDTLGLAVALEPGTTTLPGLVGLHSSGRQMGERRSLSWGANFVMAVIRLHDEAFVQGAFEVPANSFDSFTMLPLRIMGKPGVRTEQYNSVSLG